MSVATSLYCLFWKTLALADCLIVAALADVFAEELSRLTDERVSAIACATASDARAAYTDETVLFGSPETIAELIDEMPSVDWVQSSWAGVRPLMDARRRDFQVTGVKGVFGPQMAEYALGHILAHELRLVERREKQQARQWWREPSGTLIGKHLGVLGTGSIGAAIAKAAKPFGVNTRGLNRGGNPVEGFDQIVAASDIERFLDGLDYLVSTLPDTAATENLLDKRRISLLPSGALFINVGRSNVIDDQALCTALDDGRLAGAVLDVFDVEPLPPEDPLWSTPRLTVTAHVAAISHPLLIVPIFVENFRRYRAGEPLLHTVDFSAGY